METITTERQLKKVDVDIRVRMRHHAPAVQRIGELLECCILGNPGLQVAALMNKDRYGYCYKITTPTNQRLYITYDHEKQIIFVKDKMRNFRRIHEFKNDASPIEIVTEVRRIFI